MLINRDIRYMYSIPADRLDSLILNTSDGIITIKGYETYSIEDGYDIYEIEDTYINTLEEYDADTGETLSSTPVGDEYKVYPDNLDIEGYQSIGLGKYARKTKLFIGFSLDRAAQ